MVIFHVFLYVYQRVGLFPAYIPRTSLLLLVYVPMFGFIPPPIQNMIIESSITIHTDPIVVYITLW